MSCCRTPMTIPRRQERKRLFPLTWNSILRPSISSSSIQENTSTLRTLLQFATLTTRRRLQMLKRLVTRVLDSRQCFLITTMYISTPAIILSGLTRMRRIESIPLGRFFQSGLSHVVFIPSSKQYLIGLRMTIFASNLL